MSKTPMAASRRTAQRLKPLPDGSVVEAPGSATFERGVDVIEAESTMERHSCRPAGSPRLTTSHSEMRRTIGA